MTKREIQEELVKEIERKVDGAISNNLEKKDLGKLAKIIPKLVYEDCLKEEQETVRTIDDFSKFCGKITMQHLRNICN